MEILYDRMKTAVTGEEADGHIVLQPLPAGAGPALRLPAAPAGHTGQDEGQGRAAFLLHRLDSSFGPLVSQPRRSTLSSGPSSTPSPTSACSAPRSRSSRRPSLPSRPTCSRLPALLFDAPAQAGAARQPRRLRLDRRGQLLQRAGPDGAGRRGASVARSRSASSTVVGSWQAIRSWRDGDNTASLPTPAGGSGPGHAARSSRQPTIGPTLSAAMAITSPGARGRSTRPSRAARHRIGGRS